MKAQRRDYKKTTGHPRSFDPRSFGLRACPRVQKTYTQIANLLRERGDGLPEAVIRSATSKANRRQWTAWCTAAGLVASAVRVEPSDWYLCTMKNAVTHGDFEGRGLGTAVYATAAHRALNDKKANPDAFCKVLAADIRKKNKGSHIPALRTGLKPVGSFCWDRNSEPEVIYHYASARPGPSGECGDAVAGRAKRRRR